MKSTAEKKNIYIFRANGSILTNNSVSVLDYSMNPGDVLVVPQQIEFKNNFKIFLDSVGAIFQIATVLMTIATLVLTIHALQ